MDKLNLKKKNNYDNLKVIMINNILFKINFKTKKLINFFIY